MRYLIIMAWLVVLPSYALQIKTVVDDEPVTAAISTQELTRVSVEGDKIASVVGMSGSYLLQNDEGAIFIKPTVIAKEHLNLFISTQADHHYILRLNPRNIQADTIILKPKFLKQPSDSYQQKLMRLITAMVTRSVDEYSVSNFPSEKPQYMLDKAKIFLVSTYQDEELHGEIYRLINKNKKAITLREEEFFREGAKAIALQDNLVPPKSETFIYMGF